MTDSGKHSALRQTSDGSFELVVDQGLHEVSEEEVSVAEVVPPPAEAEVEPPSKRVLAIGLVALLVLGIVGAAAFMLIGSDGETSDEEVAEIGGFRPYGGGGEKADDKKNVAGQKAVRAALAELDEEEADEQAEAQPAQEITESEPGWELTEAEELAAQEGVEVVEVEPIPVEEEIVEEEVVEDEEVIEEEIVEAEEGDEMDPRSRLRMGREQIKSLRGKQFGRDLTRPRLPQLNANPLDGTRQIKNLPIRNLEVGEAPSEDDEVDYDEEIDPLE